MKHSQYVLKMESLHNFPSEFFLGRVFKGQEKKEIEFRDKKQIYFLMEILELSPSLLILFGAPKDGAHAILFL